nr:C69 family dipeptidase [Edwardsiella ictaluri]
MIYLSYGMPSISLYIPFYPNAGGDVPAAYGEVTSGEADTFSAQWQFRKLQTLIMVNYYRYAPGVQQEYQRLESRFSDLQKAMESEYIKIYQEDMVEADRLLQRFGEQVFAEALETTQTLTNRLFTQLAQDVNAKYLFAGA